MSITTTSFPETQEEISSCFFDYSPCPRCDFYMRLLLDVIGQLIELRTISSLLASPGPGPGSAGSLAGRSNA